MKDTKSKSVKDKSKGVTYSAGRIWTDKQLENYRKYQVNFLRDTYRTFVVRLKKEGDKKLISFLEKQDNVTEYIKNLIVEDMKKKK